MPPGRKEFRACTEGRETPRDFCRSFNSECIPEEMCALFGHVVGKTPRRIACAFCSGCRAILQKDESCDTVPLACFDNPFSHKTESGQRPDHEKIRSVPTVRIDQFFRCF